VLTTVLEMAKESYINVMEVSNHESFIIFFQRPRNYGWFFFLSYPVSFSL